ncbi:hypothetical protein GYMLUDRAFT_383755 [Collybiopsis luxurians FD-317 M1]|nr:hypothetical protein GYMLUDRAFT_383755 [Collybiopsis luxurians FD-317 M1]
MMQKALSSIPRTSIQEASTERLEPTTIRDASIGIMAVPGWGGLRDSGGKPSSSIHRYPVHPPPWTCPSLPHLLYPQNCPPSARPKQTVPRIRRGRRVYRQPRPAWIEGVTLLGHGEIL